MTEQFNIYDAKTQLSRLIDRAAGGEEIVIARNGRPVARLVALGEARRPIRFGLARGQIWIAPDFDELPEELLQAFEGNGN